MQEAAADDALGRAQSVNQRQFATARPRIEQFAIAKPAGQEADAVAIDIDSRAAWDGWR